MGLGGILNGRRAAAYMVGSLKTAGRGVRGAAIRLLRV